MPTPEQIRIITVIAFIFLLAIGIKRTVWLTIAYFLLVYTKMSSYYPFLGEIKSELVFAILILIRLLAKGDFAAKLSIRNNPINKNLYLFIVCVFLSFSVAWDRQYSWDEAVYHFIKVVLLYFMVALSIEDQRDLKIFIWSIISVYVYLAYEPVFYFINRISGSHQVYGINYISELGILAGHVGAANNMNQMIPIAFYLFLGIQKKNLKILASIPLVIFIICLIGTGSRGGVVGFMFFGLCVVYFSKHRVKVGVIVGIAAVMLLIFTGLSSTVSRIRVRSAEGRFTGGTHGIEMLKRGNILGVGPGCFRFARGRYFGYTMESHNLYGQLVGELGIPGTIAWFFFIRQIFLNLIESKRRLKAMAKENSFLFHLAMALQVSLMVRLFVCLASHSLFFFYWYIVAPMSFLILENVKKLENNGDLEKSKKPLSGEH